MSEKRPSILVVGSINMDLVLRMDRVPLPGESFIGREYRHVPGGKGANQAVAAARLGAEVTFVGRVGDDAHGQKLKTQLAAQGISTDLLVTDSGSQTGLAVILLEESGRNRIVVYPGANMEIRPEDLAAAFRRTYDAVMLVLEIPLPMVVEVCRLARANGIPAILDAGPARAFDLTQVRGLEILTPNETETSALTDLPCGTPEEASKAARALAEKSDARYVVLKMGEEGSLLHADGRDEIFPAHRVSAVDTTAAGDAFTAAMAVEYVRSGDIARAIRYATAAGALAVTRLGAQPSLPTADEVRQFIQQREVTL